MSLPVRTTRKYLHVHMYINCTLVTKLPILHIYIYDDVKCDIPLYTKFEKLSYHTGSDYFAPGCRIAGWPFIAFYLLVIIIFPTPHLSKEDLHLQSTDFVP